MIAIKILLPGFVALVSGFNQPVDVKFAALLKRQAPGTPLYNCHDNCGTAITLSRQPNKCEIEAFKTDYQSCLQCAGPDNYNTWRMYGNTLSTAGASCGLSTEPLAGKQEDVGPAVHVGSTSSAGAASATPAPASATVTSSAGLTSASEALVVSGNPTPALPQQSTNAGVHLGSSGVLGAIVFGAMAML